MEMKIFLQKLVSWCCEQGKEYEEIINTDDFFVMSVIITIEGQKKKSTGTKNIYNKNMKIFSFLS